MSNPAIVYSEQLPPDDLLPFVHCVWRFKAPQETDSQPIVPDGRPELIIHLGVSYRETDKTDPQPRILLAGQLTKPLTLVPQGPTDILAVRFRPDGARAVFGADMHHATDRRIDFEAIQPPSHPSPLDPIWDTHYETLRVETICRFVRNAVKGVQPDPLVRRGVDAIMQGEPHHAPSGISLRQYQRRFKSAVGISPRELQSIRRFRSIFDRLQADQGGSWTDRALDAGYFDQPQMARDFRRYLGCSARQWVTQQSGLARKLSETEG